MSYYMKFVILISTFIFALLTFIINREKLVKKYKMVLVKNKGFSKYVNTTLGKINRLCEQYKSCNRFLPAKMKDIVKKKK